MRPGRYRRVCLSRVARSEKRPTGGCREAAPFRRRQMPGRERRWLPYPVTKRDGFGGRPPAAHLEPGRPRRAMELAAEAIA